MEHRMFRPSSLEEAKHLVVGDCKGVRAATRWEHETPAFVAAIARQVSGCRVVLDYGCGCGRIARGVVESVPTLERLYGLDTSREQLHLARHYVSSERFIGILPHEITERVDAIYCIYVLQHVPAVELRDVIGRMHFWLKDSGTLTYCSSERRMAIRYDGGGVYDDRHLGVDIMRELERFFVPVGDLFTLQELDASPILRAMICEPHAHPAIVFRRRALSGRTPHVIALDMERRGAAVPDKGRTSGSGGSGL